MAQALLRLCLHTGDAEAVLGDLDETYAHLHHRYGPREARRWYRSQVFRSMPRFATLTLAWSFVMLKSYLKIALRTVRRQKGYAFINVFGLMIGLTCVLLIALYIRYENSFDAFHANAERIYRMAYEAPKFFYQDKNQYAVSPLRLSEVLRDEVPAVENATTFDPDELRIGYADQFFYETGLWADQAFLEVFTFPLLRGSPATALTDTDAMLLSERLAAKLFGEADPMGRIVTLEDGEAFTVAGILENPPKNAHFHFDFIVPLQRRRGYERAQTNWGNTSFRTYFVLRPGYTVDDVEASMLPIVQIHHSDLLEQDPENVIRYFAQPLTSIHLDSDLVFEIEPNSDVRYLYLLAVVGGIILLLACINYMNLATARSLRRATEVGIRQLIGARRLQIISQHLGETVLMALVAAVLAVLAAYLSLPAFNTLVDRSLSLRLSEAGVVLGGLVLFAMVVGLLAGSYPAFFMASLAPVDVLKGSLRQGSRTGRLRRLLVTLQFAASLVLIIATFAVYQQLQYIQNKKLGYAHEQRIALRLDSEEAQAQHETIEATLRTHPDVLSTTVVSALPTQILATSDASWPGKPEEVRASMHLTQADYSFTDFFEIKLVAGRSFSRDFAADAEGAYLINEAAARLIGEDAVGTMLRLWPGEGPVVGVMEDFHFQPLHQPIRPLAVRLAPDQLHYVVAKLQTDHLPETLDFLETTLTRFAPAYPFQYQFMDDAFHQQYQNERRTGQMLGALTLLALCIACLGLFGLAAYAAEQRTKEIGIRKVLGATTSGIVLLLSKDFARLVVFAFVLATPVAYVVARRWLDGFAYHVDLSWTLFLAAGLVTLAVAGLTISYQALKAALADPANSLRHE